MMKKAYPEAAQLFAAVRTLREASEIQRVLQDFQAA